MLSLLTLLHDAGIEPERTLVFRHRPLEPALNRALPWLAQDRPDLFNLYQQTHGPKTEAALKRAKWIASFISGGSQRALFVGLYQMAGVTEVTNRWCAEQSGYQELVGLGLAPFSEPWLDDSRLFFDLRPYPELESLKGRLVIGWPAARSYYLWAERGTNRFPIAAIHEHSALVKSMPPWEVISFSWSDLHAIPRDWCLRLEQWRGVYLIIDQSDGQAYVGSAYGQTNILGRWLSYAATGHGGNKLLRTRNPANFKFSILQRLSPDQSADDVIASENSWKVRLNTRVPFGLNEN